MSAYADFMSDYNIMASKQEIKSSTGEKMKYGWFLGAELQKAFKNHLKGEEIEEDIDPLLREQFPSTFEEGKEMLGFPIYKIIEGNKIYLYVIEEKKDKCDFNDVEWEIPATNLKPNNRVKDPITGLMFNWKYIIKGESLTIKGEPTPTDEMNGDNRQCKDTPSKGLEGSIIYQDNKISYAGKINYNTGNISLIRTLKENVTKAEDVATEFNKLTDMTTLPWGESSNSSSGSSSSSSEKVDPPDKVIYTKEKIKVDYTYFVPPVTILWEWEYKP